MFHLSLVLQTLSCSWNESFPTCLPNSVLPEHSWGKTVVSTSYWSFHWSRLDNSRLRVISMVENNDVIVIVSGIQLSKSYSHFTISFCIKFQTLDIRNGKNGIDFFNNKSPECSHQHQLLQCNKHHICVHLQKHPS